MSGASGSSRKRAPVGAANRLKQDYMRIMKDPVPYILAQPLPSNILEWHYCVKGPEDSPYVGGFYHGKLVFPSDYPFSPPKILMLTPNGRFKVNTRLCLSISDFHPDTWNPAWSVSTILTGLLSFMLEDTATLGSVNTSPAQKRGYAHASGEYNLKNSTFCELFPELVEEIKCQVAAAKAKAESQSSTSTPGDKNLTSATASPTHSVVGNFAVFLAIGAFAWTVHYVLSNAAV